MDLSSTFKGEIFRPIATIAVPGTFATTPFLFLLGSYFPGFINFWDKHDSATTFLIIMVVVAVGLLLEDFGARIEHHVLDPSCKKHNSQHDEEWYKYLQLSFEKEPIGHRYLRTITLRLKFELAFGLSLIPFLIGLVWLNNRTLLLESTTVCLFGLFVSALILYLMYEAHSSSKLLSKIRTKILNKFEDVERQLPG